MSAALYKFLRKAALSGEPGADAILRNIGRSARHDILDSIAHIKPAGVTDETPMLGEKLPWIGDKGRQMLKDTWHDLVLENEPIPPGALPLSADARRMYSDWSDKRFRKK